MKAENHIDEGTLAIATGDLAQAVEHFRKAVEVDAQSFDAWHSLGMALMKLGRFPEAIEAGIRAVTLEPQNPLARVSLSIYFQKNGQIAEAEAEAAKAKVLSWGGKLLPNEPGKRLS